MDWLDTLPPDLEPRQREAMNPKAIERYERQQALCIEAIRHGRAGNPRTIIWTPRRTRYWFNFGTHEWSVPFSPDDYRVEQQDDLWLVFFIPTGAEIYRGAGPVRVYSAPR
ncbi:hypothetical protein [Hydrogenophaga intermedia]|nr:hypothetical protein [Hydrogenophaga intermedia]TMU70124.1 hypothetical protein FGJ01_24340 [Hydrogenophaga intermedia]